MAPGVNRVKWWPSPNAKPTDDDMQLGMRLLFNAVNDHDQAITTLATQGDTSTTITTSGSSAGGVGPPGPPGPGGLPGAGGLNNQTGATAYTTTAMDNGIFLVLSDSSAIAVTLNSGLTAPYYLFATNLGTGTATLTPSSGTVNGAASFALTTLHTAIVGFDGTNWFASATPVIPATFAAVTSQWLRSYNSATGTFTASQPAFTDISGSLALSQLPSAGISVTIATAKLTLAGANGSMVFTGGLLTSQTAAT